MNELDFFLIGTLKREGLVHGIIKTTVLAIPIQGNFTTWISINIIGDFTIKKIQNLFIHSLYK